MRGVRLAFSMLSVLPVRVDHVDRETAGRAITAAPLVGLVLGVLAAGAALGGAAIGLAPLLVGVLVVGLLAIATRGMHVDGLGDVADGLGCYGPPERALKVMHDPAAGPFAVVALIVNLGAQAAAISSLIAQNRWGAIVIAVVAGRVAFGWGCRRGVPPAQEKGLGALVAGTQPAVVPAIWTALLAAAAITVHPWLGPLAVLAATAAVLGLLAHTTKRFGGVNGDVLGACCEVATTVVFVVLSGK
ncbi:adenosylcobinamide-GDP ribazoletransferase [Allokutzneria sp. A3M-2-11 16]|uniref:adenosylcobinamide-GDP ribazoletransferase n=1 Tax=Allokutzneria sp. A3M-2-11 16 TaxID=2962043 RepID=UPI0020B6DA47|nr:adenosylcobinamide-GDP ribazoletransferase [Allokutzneria sp. A3M-2-11 16]MCP3801808.1 adenosylcobinamide-GDP ribazoletransferase [Allokutzneria sp. A3M-2-11 16]